MLFDLVHPNVHISDSFPGEIVFRVHTKNLVEEIPVEVIGDGGTIEGEFFDSSHSEAPATAQVGFYRIPREVKSYSFVSWDPESDVYSGYGVAVERVSGKLQIAILSEDDMGIEPRDFEDEHEDIIRTLTSYDTNGEPSSYASIVVDFP